MIWLDMCLIAIVFMGVIVLGNNRLRTTIQLFAAQSFLLCLVPIMILPGFHAGILALETFVLKVVLMPLVFFWAIRHVSIRREGQPLISYGHTLLLGGVLIAGSFLISARLDLPVKISSNLLVPCAFSVIMIGFLLLVTRFKAITQIIGYLVMENGIFLFALLLLEKTPLLVEMGILLDIFVGVLIMGVIVNQINQEFGSASTVNLVNLKE
ncbi:MAG: hydrogenase [Candidatus Omnitrophica bacterium]|nr:hydrogenase [Candidatus Omnitrophota bacterium]